MISLATIQSEPSFPKSKARKKRRRVAIPKFSKMGNFVTCFAKPRKKLKRKRSRNEGSDLVKYREMIGYSLRSKSDSAIELSPSSPESVLSDCEFLDSEKTYVEENQDHELFCPLTFEEEKKVSNALSGRKSHEVLVMHEASNIEIARKDIQCLKSGAWLNDEVINLYLALLKEREIREPKRFLKCHFFNTFFFKKLISGKNGYDFNAVRRWTAKRKLGYTLIECDKIFVPIHKDVHWCLAVINIKDKTFQYLDSLGGMDAEVLRLLARYFMDEVEDKSDKSIDTSSWKKGTVQNLPRQMNGFDCGMFMLKYIDFYSRGLDLHFSQKHMEYFRKRMIKEILKLRAD